MNIEIQPVSPSNTPPSQEQNMPPSQEQNTPPTEEHDGPLNVTWDMEKKCKGNKLESTIIKLYIKGGTPDYDIQPKPTFSLVGGGVASVKIMDSKNRTWEGVITAPKNCNDKSIEDDEVTSDDPLLEEPDPEEPDPEEPGCENPAGNQKGWCKDK